MNGIGFSVIYGLNDFMNMMKLYVFLRSIKKIPIHYFLRCLLHTALRINIFSCTLSILQHLARIIIVISPLLIFIIFCLLFFTSI
ncbi:hypothetical protein DET59_12176 [Rossellomorea aquimaris]|uniref:Uncharacterized protein n=1 Tax=Rossellomorea aquimaris TaxID=189382 RepID=A0A366EFI6_9BACI|nr:hypothetical protein DET59_12176 [Rossellomorea aquimaris]